MSRQRKPNYLLIGLMSVFLGHVIFALAMFGVATLIEHISPDPYAIFFPILAIGFIGITQLVYVIPIILWLRYKRRFDTMKGVIVGAVFTALLNGSCYLLALVATQSL